MRRIFRRGVDVVVITVAALVAGVVLLVTASNGATALPAPEQLFSNLALSLSPNNGPAGASSWSTQAQATGLDAGQTYRVAILGPQPGTSSIRNVTTVVANPQGNVIIGLTLPGGPGVLPGPDGPPGAAPLPNGPK